MSRSAASKVGFSSGRRPSIGTSSLSSGASTSRSNAVILLAGPYANKHVVNYRSQSKIDILARNLSSQPCPTAEDGNALADALATEPAQTSYLTLPVKRMCESSDIKVRIAGYRLIRSICAHQKCFTALEGRTMWLALTRVGLEKEREARMTQVDALGQWLAEKDESSMKRDLWLAESESLWRVCRVADVILSWIKEVTRPGMMDQAIFSRLDEFVRRIIETEGRWRVTEVQVETLLEIYCEHVHHLSESRLTLPSKAYPTPASSPEEGHQDFGHRYRERSVSLEETGERLVNLVKSIRNMDLIPSSALPMLIATLCHLLMDITEGCERLPSGKQHDEPIWANPVAELIQRTLVHFFNSDTHSSQVIHIFESFLVPKEGSHANWKLALSALMIERHVILVSTIARIGIPGAVTKDHVPRSDTSVLIDLLMLGLRGVPKAWMGRPGGDKVIVELGSLVERVMVDLRYTRRSELAAFVGGVVAELTGSLELYKSQTQQIYKVSILEHSAAPTPAIAELERLLRIAHGESNKVMEPPMTTTLLNIAHHLSDNFLLKVFEKLQTTNQLQPNPSAWKWKHTLRILLDLFKSHIHDYPQSRKAIAMHIAKSYTSDSREMFHDEMGEDVVKAFEMTLPYEQDVKVIKAAFDVCLNELILSHETHRQRSDRAREMWTKLALDSNSIIFGRILAVKFLILGFNRFAFSSPQSFKVKEQNEDWKQSESAYKTAISLYRDIVALAGLQRDANNEVIGPLLQCQEARLVVLQWLLRLRAGADHRIFAVAGPMTEVIPIAQIAGRVRGEEESIPVPLEQELKIDPVITERKRWWPWPRRASAASTLALRSPTATLVPTETRPQPEETSTTMVLPGSPVSLKAQNNMLWTLPDRVRTDLFLGTSKPSPAMVTFKTHAQSGYWLITSKWVATIADILENDCDWEIMSYILCHLPLQLANKHFFCGPVTSGAIRQLVKTVCNAIKGNRLYESISLTSSPLASHEVKAMLYHTLMVLTSYRNRFNRIEGQQDIEGVALVNGVIESFIEGVECNIVASRLCLEGLTLVLYSMHADLAKHAITIVRHLDRKMSDPDVAPYALEFLLDLGFRHKVIAAQGVYRRKDYERVFGVALTYIKRHYQSDRPTLLTSEGNISYSLAQHMLRIAYLVIHTWFIRMKADERPHYFHYITAKLRDVNPDPNNLRPTTIVALDSLSRYAYSTVDPKVTPSFIYKSVLCPDLPIDQQSLRLSWRDRQKKEMENVANIQAFKVGLSLVTISILKQPRGWFRICVRRPSVFIDLVARLEGIRLSTFTLERHGDETSEQTSLDIDEALIAKLVQSMVSNEQDERSDLKTPDPISGLPLSDTTRPLEHSAPALSPELFARVFASGPDRVKKFPDYKSLVGKLEMIDLVPVMDLHKIGVVYVAPGQADETSILANRHGSPAYTRFLRGLGRLVKLRDELEIYTGHLRAEKHGEYTLAWWDDIGQVLFHVGTFMPHIGDATKAEIGNCHVKIVWNDGGRPYRMKTIDSQFNLVNIVIEPHTDTPEAVYQTNWHVHGYFKVLLQVDSRLPRITPIGEFKIVAIDDLPRMIRHFALNAALLCAFWTGTDGGLRPLQTNWQKRMEDIQATEKLLLKAPAEDYDDHGLLMPNETNC